MKTTKRLLSLLFFSAFLNVSYAQTYLSQTLEYDGETREYQIYIPSIYDGTTAVPLIFSFHGGGGYIEENIAINDLSTLADTANFIAVYPQALPDPNDDGNPLWIHKDPTTVDDVFFIDALIDAIADSYQIDQNKIYACGYSHGGEFTLSLACRLNDRIAAIGVVARTMQTYTYNNCAPTHPTGVMTILGTADWISDYNGIWWQGVQYYVSAVEMHEFWATQNNCNTTASITEVPNSNPSDGSTVERHTWFTSDGCAYVEELKVIGGGHDWPGTFGNMDINATEEIWQFVSRYSLDGLITCNSTSINEHNSPQLSYTAYPNPVNKELTIETTSPDDQVFNLYSSIGQLILTGTLSTDTNSIDVSSLPSGTYFLTVDNQTSRLVKVE